MEPVKEFQGQFRFLSNFYPALVKYEGQFFETVEHAYQAAKTLDFDARMKFVACVGLTAGEAKRMGRKLKIRPDWEEVKVEVMRLLLRQKFQIEVLRNKLLATGDAELIEGNNWGDKFWGVCRGQGQNMLGKLLMETREVIRGSQV